MNSQPAAGPGRVPNHYEALEVASTASARIIRLAYRELARQHHPDHGGSDHEMTRIAEAYQALSDPVRRAAYDKTLSDAAGVDGATHTGEYGPGDDEFEDEWGEDHVETPPSETGQGTWRSDADVPPAWAPTTPPGHAFPWEGTPHTRPADPTYSVPPVPTVSERRRIGILRVTGTGTTVWLARVTSWILFVLLVVYFVVAIVISLVQGRVSEAVSALGSGAALGALAYFGASIRMFGGRISKRYVFYLLLCLATATFATSGLWVVGVLWTLSYVLAVESRNRLVRQPP